MKLSKEAKAGIIVVAAIALFVFGFNFLKGRNIFTTQRVFYAVYSQVDGLVDANPVLINGFKIGQIQKLELAPDNSGRILVTIMIDNDEIKIPKNSIAKIVSSDILGSKAIEINLGNSVEMANDKDTLQSEVQASLTDEVNKQVKPIKDKAEKLISSIDSILVVVQAILNEGAKDDIVQSFESIKKSIKTFEHTAHTLDAFVSNEQKTISAIFAKIESITGNLANSNEKITLALNNITNITDSIAKSNLKSTIDNTNKAMQNASAILDKINTGEGTIGMLINDKKIYNELDSASKALSFLLTDMEKYPGVYFPLKGKKDQRRKERDQKKKN